MRDEPCTAPNRDHRVMTARVRKELAFPILGPRASCPPDGPRTPRVPLRIHRRPVRLTARACKEPAFLPVTAGVSAPFHKTPISIG